MNEKDAKMPKILICVTGSVAAIKIPEIVIILSKFADIQLICTKSAMHFIHCCSDYHNSNWNEFNKIGGLERFLVDEQIEWQSWNRVNDGVLHIDLQKWADMIVVLPASADIIAKLSVGISDTFLLTVLKAWDLKKPCLIFPAMNTNMWNHPSTIAHLDTLKR